MFNLKDYDIAVMKAKELAYSICSVLYPDVDFVHEFYFWGFSDDLFIFLSNGCLPSIDIPYKTVRKYLLLEERGEELNIPMNVASSYPYDRQITMINPNLYSLPCS